MEHPIFHFKNLKHPNLRGSLVIDYIDELIHHHKMTTEEATDFMYLMRRRQDNRVLANINQSYIYYPYNNYDCFLNLDHPNVNWIILSFIAEIIIQPLDRIEYGIIKHMVYSRRRLNCDDKKRKIEH